MQSCFLIYSVKKESAAKFQIYSYVKLFAYLSKSVMTIFFLETDWCVTYLLLCARVYFPHPLLIIINTSVVRPNSLPKHSKEVTIKKSCLCIEHVFNFWIINHVSSLVKPCNGKLCQNRDFTIDCIYP